MRILLAVICTSSMATADAIYYAPPQDGCVPVNQWLSRCDNNVLAQKPGEDEGKFLDRDNAWGMLFEEQYPNCEKIDDNLLRCRGGTSGQGADSDSGVVAISVRNPTRK